VAAVVALTAPASTGVGWASVPPPFLVSPSTLPSAGGLENVQLATGYTGSCPLTTTNPGVSLANCVPPNDDFDVWVPPNTSSSTLVTTFNFSGSIGGMPPSTSSSSVTQSAPTTSRTYVALGDSYSAGEGNPDPRNGGWVDLNGRPDKTPTALDGCDRSWLSYPRRTASWMSTESNFPRMQFVFLACSGVTTSDIWPGSPAASYGLRGPTTRHMEGVQLDDTPDLRHARIVTMTVGANDIGFSPVGAVCTPESITHPEGGSPATRAREARSSASEGKEGVGDELTQPESKPCVHGTTTPSARASLPKIDHLEQTLVATYSHVEAAAPDAALYIMGYPYLVPPSPSPGILRSGCDSIPGLEMAHLAKLEVALDAAVKEAARAVGANYVDPNGDTPADFPDHTICSTKGVWFNGLMSVSRYSYHPDATGQVKLFEDLRSSIEAHGLAPRAVCGRVPSSSCTTASRPV
jgi:GDSL-like Lipase/Acylhydrolase family